MQYIFLHKNMLKLRSDLSELMEQRYGRVGFFLFVFAKFHPIDIP